MNSLLIWSVCAASLFLPSILSASMQFQYERSLDLDRNYVIFWSVAGNSIVLKVVVRSLGYVGFGLTTRAGMDGSDISLGGVSSGQGYLKDCFIQGNNILPDAKQSWALLMAAQNETHTTLVARRKLVTCDPHDLPITEDTVRFVSFYGQQDIEKQLPSVAEIQKQMTVTPHYFLRIQPNYDSQGLQTFEITAQQTAVPGDKVTTYWCNLRKVPNLGKKHHIVMIEPNYDPKENAELIHHSIPFNCFNVTQQEIDQYLDKMGFDCTAPTEPLFYKCYGSLITQFGKGTQKWSLPPEVGIPFGDSDDRYFLLQVHYNNYKLEKGIVDSSGYRFYYTANLRKYDGGMITLASTLLLLELPPRQPTFMVTAHCALDCINNMVPEDGITIYNGNFHTHALGRSARVRHFRGNKEMPNILSDETFDSDNQAYRNINPLIKILPGDQFTIECFFDTTSKDETVLGGLSTSDEMCFSFLNFYPLVGHFLCTSAPIGGLLTGLMGVSAESTPILTYPEYVNGTPIQTFANGFDWIHQPYVKAAELVMTQGPHVVDCRLNNQTKSTKNAMYPRNLVPNRLASARSRCRT